MYFTLHIGIKLYFDIRRKRVLPTIFVLILNIKLSALIFYLIPSIYQKNI